MNRWTVFGSCLTAFVIGAAGASGVGLLAGSGKLNTGALIGIVATGAVVAAKDYRSLMKLPPVGPADDQTKP